VHWTQEGILVNVVGRLVYVGSSCRLRIEPDRRPSAAAALRAH
jgi:hypothetical protein